MDLIGKLTGQMIASGVFKDLPHNEPAFWADIQNVYSSDNSIQPIPGQYILTSSLTGVPIKGIKASVIDGVRTLFYGVYNKLYKWTEAGGAQEIGSGYTNGLNTRNLWSFARWSDWMLATNNLDPPQIWKGSAFTALTGLGTITKGKFFIPYGEYMILVNGSEIYWCARANVEDWVATAANAAGALYPQDLDGPFMGGIVHGQVILLFTLNSMHVMEYIGPPNFFGVRRVAHSYGIFGIQALTGHDKKVYGFGPVGAFITDGDGCLPIDEGTVHDDIFASLSETETEKALVWHSKHTKQICFWWPGAGSQENDRSYAFKYTNAGNTWAGRTDRRTAAEESGIFPWGILADASGGIYAENTADDPVSIQDGALPIEGSGTYTLGFGESGFGQGGFGGTAEWTE